MIFYLLFLIRLLLPEKMISPLRLRYFQQYSQFLGFLVTPHEEVLEYVKRKGNDRDRWIEGMQRLQKQFEEFLTPPKGN